MAKRLCWMGQGKLVGRVFEWLLPQPVDDCLRVLSSCLLGGKSVTPLMCSTSETIGSNSADDGEDTVSCPITIIMRVSPYTFGGATNHMCSNCRRRLGLHAIWLHRYSCHDRTVSFENDRPT